MLESIESGKKQDVMNQLNGFVKDLQSNIHAYDVKLLQDIFEFIKGDELTKAYKFGLDVVNEFKKQNLFASALPLVHSILFPTIFDAPEHQDATPTKVPLGSMISFKSLSTLWYKSKKKKKKSPPDGIFFLSFPVPETPQGQSGAHIRAKTKQTRPWTGCVANLRTAMLSSRCCRSCTT